MTKHQPSARCPDCGRAPPIMFSSRQVNRAKKDRQRARIQEVQCHCGTRYWIQARHIANAEPKDDGRIPRGFPGRGPLRKAGITTFTELAGVELLEVDGIGPATAEAIAAELDGLDAHQNVA